jgi:hypothetical protein
LDWCAAKKFLLPSIKKKQRGWFVELTVALARRMLRRFEESPFLQILRERARCAQTATGAVLSGALKRRRRRN